MTMAGIRRLIARGSGGHDGRRGMFERRRGRPSAPSERTEAQRCGVATTKVASVAGGPHPFFTPWEQGTADAVKDFGLVGGVYKFPPQWELTAQNNMVETLVAQGYNAFNIFPGDANGTNALLDELKAQGIPSIAAGGCTSEPSPAAFCFATDVYNSAYIGTKALIAAMGDICTASRPVPDRPHREPPGRPEHAGPHQGRRHGRRRVRRARSQVLQHLTDSDDQEAATEKVDAILASNGDEIDGMISVAYVGSSVAATLLTNIGDKRIKFIGIDDDPAVLDAIKDGFVGRHDVPEPVRPGLPRLVRHGPAPRRLHGQGGLALPHRHRHLPDHRRRRQRRRHAQRRRSPTTPRSGSTSSRRWSRPSRTSTSSASELTLASCGGPCSFGGWAPACAFTAGLCSSGAHRRSTDRPPAGRSASARAALRRPACARTGRERCCACIHESAAPRRISRTPVSRSDTVTTRTLSRGLDVLEALAAADEFGLGPSAIAERSASTRRPSPACSEPSSKPATSPRMTGPGAIG